MSEVRWGVLGVAGIAMRAVIPAIQRARNARLVAIASRDAGRAAEAGRRLGVPRTYGSYDALFDDPEVQAVYIPLPNSLHHRWTLRCAEAGRHVLCEKPLAPTAAECEEMAAACRERRVTLMEAFMYRFHPRTVRVAALAAGGALGDVRAVRAAFTFATRERAANIRFRPDLAGGALYDVGCYTVNVSRMLLGEPEAVFATGRKGGTGVDEEVRAVLRFADGRAALIDCALVLPRREEYEVVGTEAQIQVAKAFLPGTADAEIVLTRGGERTAESIPGVDEYQVMVEQFGDAVAAGRPGSRRGPRPAPLPVEDAAANVRVLQALHASLESGRVEPVR